MQYLETDLASSHLTVQRRMTDGPAHKNDEAGRPDRAVGARVCSSLYQAFMLCQLPESGQYISKSIISWKSKHMCRVNNILNLQVEIELNFPVPSYICVVRSLPPDLGPLVSWHQIFPVSGKTLDLGLIKFCHFCSYCLLPTLLPLAPNIFIAYTACPSFHLPITVISNHPLHVLALLCHSYLSGEL